VTPPRAYDVVIVGAGIAGCTAARMYGEHELRVALVDKRTDVADYKRMCTHFIQPAATPVIERIGLAPLIEEAGAVRNTLDTWTRWGWIRVPQPDDGTAKPYGYSIRRQTLDPILRKLAAETPGVELMLGWTAEELIAHNGLLAGVVVRGRDGSKEELRGQLVVAADGRDSRIGDLAGVRARVKKNNRFMYFAHYRNLVQTSGEAGQFWIRDPDTAIAYPNDDGVSLVATCIHRSRLEEFKRDLERNFNHAIETLPEAPDLAGAERVSPLRGKLAMPNASHRVAAGGLAFIGDAAMTSDPLWAVGCGNAFLSACWLVDCTAPALGKGEHLGRALRRYRRRHRSQLRGFQFQSSSYSAGRPASASSRAAAALKRGQGPRNGASVHGLWRRLDRP
jgi:flavin-dependent dehydrogenase